MNPEKAKALALRHMTQHGLITAGWRFAFNNRKRALGLCSYTKRTIYLSSYFLPRIPEDELVDTILHEIAHALDLIRHGRCSGHGVKWQAIAREIGAKPLRCADVKVQHRYAYVLKYGDVVVRGYHRLPPGLVQKLPSMGLRGRPETRGKLKLYKMVYR